MRSYNEITRNGSIAKNDSYEGEPLHLKIRKVVSNNEPIDSTAPIIWTNRADGVQPAYDIRADRWEIALDATDKISASHLAKRKSRMELMKGGAETAVHTSDQAGEAS